MFCTFTRSIFLKGLWVLLFAALGFGFSSITNAQTNIASTPVPRVSLSANPNRLTTGNPVNFRANLSRAQPGLKFRFVFGDGSASGWQSGADATHVYTSPGTFLAYVDVGLPVNGVMRQMGGTLRQPVIVVPLTTAATPVRSGSVTPSPKVSSPTTGLSGLTSTVKGQKSTDTSRVKVNLTTSANNIEVGKSVTLGAQPSNADGNLRYRYTFGDGTRSAWVESREMTHKFSRSGNFAARVDVARLNNRRLQLVGRSAPINFAVAKPATVSAPPKASPKQEATAAKIDQPAIGAPTAEQETSQTSQTAGAFLKNQWWKIVAAIVLLLVFGYLRWGWFTGSHAKWTAHADPGSSEVNGNLKAFSRTGPPSDPSESVYTVRSERPIVKNVRRENA